MIVEFDIRIKWINTVADLFDQNQGSSGGYRTYAAAPLPKLLILVMREAVTAVVPSPFDLHQSREDRPKPKYECLIGYHEAEAPAGYTLAEAAGYRHSKLTALKPVADDVPADMLLSQILESSPVLGGMSYRDLTALEQVCALLPPDMIQLMRKQATRHFGQASNFELQALMWTAIHEYLENIQ